MFLIQNFAFGDSSAWWKCSVPFYTRMYAILMCTWKFTGLD